MDQNWQDRTGFGHQNWSSIVCSSSRECLYVVATSRDETIWVNVILHIVFKYIAIYCHIAIFDWILVKIHFIWEYGFRQ